MKTISFRLRKRQDKDLLEAVKVIDPGELSDVIREALRKELKPPQKEKSTPAKPQEWKFPVRT